MCGGLDTCIGVWELALSYAATFLLMVIISYSLGVVNGEIEQMFLFAQAATERKNSVAAFSWKYHSLCHSVLTVSHEPFDLKIFVETSQGSFFALFMLIIIFVTIF